MPRDGKPTRDKILTETKALVLDNGFSGTSIDHILEKTEITKGAFFYHFKSKNALAKALMEEYMSHDKEEMNKFLEETESLKIDPLNRILAFIQLYIDMLNGLKNEIPGCLYASYIYEPNQFDDEIKKYISESIIMWRQTFLIMLDEVLKTSQPKIEIDKQSLADQFVVIIEGAFIVSRGLNDPNIMSKQLHHYKNYLTLLFKEVLNLA